MAWRLRRRVRITRGVYMNLGKTGVSLTMRTRFGSYTMEYLPLGKVHERAARRCSKGLCDQRLRAGNIGGACGAFG
jgi:Protein of unknown function (DUF4236)